ncbi:MAG: hypothetical protein Q9164_004372 [Protoblastenia rupestris]
MLDEMILRSGILLQEKDLCYRMLDTLKPPTVFKAEIGQPPSVLGELYVVSNIHQSSEDVWSSWTQEIFLKAEAQIKWMVLQTQKTSA